MLDRNIDCDIHERPPPREQVKERRGLATTAAVAERQGRRQGRRDPRRQLRRATPRCYGEVGKATPQGGGWEAHPTRARTSPRVMRPRPEADARTTRPTHWASALAEGGGGGCVGSWKTQCEESSVGFGERDQSRQVRHAPEEGYAACAEAVHERAGEGEE